MENQSQDNIRVQHLINNDKNQKTTHNLLANLITQGGNDVLGEASIKLQSEMLRELQNKKMEILGAEMVTIKGEKGETGEKGDKGDKGDTGEQGIQGKTGFQGRVGERGPRGFRGEKGDEGSPGKDGTNGKDGKDGKNGRSVTLKTVLEFLKENLSIRDLKDAPEFKQPKMAGTGYLREITDVHLPGAEPVNGQTLTWDSSLHKWKASTPSAGTAGGVETPTGDLDGANTTYTVLNTPLFLTLNGQCLYEGSGYSLAGLTITLDLAPEAGEILRSHY